MNKPGYVTTEFWSSIVTHLLALVALVRPDLVVHANQQGLVQAFALLASSMAAGAYSYSRGRVKVAVGTAVVAVRKPPTTVHTAPMAQR